MQEPLIRMFTPCTDQLNLQSRGGWGGGLVGEVRTWWLSEPGGCQNLPLLLLTRPGGPWLPAPEACISSERLLCKYRSNACSPGWCFKTVSLSYCYISTQPDYLRTRVSVKASQISAKSLVAISVCGFIRSITLRML